MKKNIFLRKNVERPKKYVPQWQLLGKEPEVVNFGNQISGPKPQQPVVQQKPQITIAQDESTISVPRTGSSLDQSFVDLNGELVDDAVLDPAHCMIDNNNFVDPDLVEDTTDMVVDRNDFYLFVKDQFIRSGSLELIENEVKELVFGDHVLCENNNITENDIVVLKKVNIKIGVFLEQ